MDKQMVGKLQIEFDLEQSTQKILQLKQRTVESIIEIGKELIEVKRNLKHGQFLKWLEQEVEFSYRNANRFMSVASGRLEIEDIWQNKKVAVNGNFEFEPKVYNVWNFAGRNPNFGIEYPGNIPGEIALNVIYYYTNKNDLIIDPMAGGGSTIDACKFLNRKCLAYDINCVREDIEYNDVTRGFPEETKDCNLIFLDPPYYNLKAKDYIPESVSSLEINKFRKFIDNLAKDCYETIKENGIVTYLIQNYYVKFASINEYIDFIDEGIQSFKQAGFKLVNRINCPQTSQVYQPQDVKKAQEQKGMLNLVRDLLIFKKST